MKIQINNIKSKLITDSKFRKKIIILGSLFVLILIVIITTTIQSSSNDNNITYSEIKTIMENKESAIIYYYNSFSTNSNNRKVKKYLNKNSIRYYLYDDRKVDKNEYNKFLDLLGIDKDLFGCPSLIYIRNGEMYGNLINIDNNDVVQDFIDNYDLYTVK